MTSVTMKGQILTNQTSLNHFITEDCAEVLLPHGFLDLGKQNKRKKKKRKPNETNKKNPLK